MGSNPSNPLVSVIVPTKNSGSTVEHSLRSVKEQTYPNIELVVVDNHSKDGTVQLAERYGAIVHTKGPERSAQRNYGAEMAKGDYLIFLDSDIELTPDVVQECIELTQEGFEIITFPERIEGTGFWANCRAIEAQCYLGDDTVEAPRFYNKMIFLNLGGFDENLTGPEDWDLREKALSAGYDIGRIKAMTIHHEGVVRPLKRIKKKFYYGKTFDKYISKNPRVAKKQIPFLRRCYFKNWRLLMQHPLYTLGFIALKSGESVAVAVAILSSRIERWRL